MDRSTSLRLGKTVNEEQEKGLKCYFVAILTCMNTMIVMLE